jgi:hypothetical protein
MDVQLFESLLYRGESETLDFKVDQYSFEKATDEEKSELLKDILAFANAWRDSDAHILIGVQENRGTKAAVLGVTKQLEDHAVHEFVNGKTQKPVTFSYEVFPFGAMQCGIIQVPVQERPFYLRKDFGRLKANEVYIRRGSATGKATPDEIADMGKRLSTPPVPAFIVLAEPHLRSGGPFAEVYLAAWLVNQGEASAYDLQVNFEGGPRQVGFEQSIWDEKPASFPGRIQLSKYPLHRSDRQPLATWFVATAELTSEQHARLASKQRLDPDETLTSVQGVDVNFRLKILARDQPPVSIMVQFTKDEIKSLRGKTFLPVKE